MVTLNIHVEDINDATKLAKMLQKIPFIKSIDSKEIDLKTVLKKKSRKEKLKSLKQAIHDPLFLNDLIEVHEDFKFIDSENL